jgi:DNA-damage-inducible protein D
MQEIETYKEKIFEEIKHIDEDGNEYWEARELQELLGYKEWRYFQAYLRKHKLLVPKVKIVFHPILV